MWQTILRPDFLFSVATVQALSPYVFWRLGVGEFRGQDNLTYLPVVIWLVGWAAFLIGASLVNKPRIRTPQFSVLPSETALRTATVVTMAVICFQLVWLARLYGGIPILSYIRQDGAIDIATALALQEESGLGQVGSLYITTAVLHGLILLLIIRNLEQKRRDQVMVLAALVVAAAAHAINGKRQGFVRGAVFLVTGLALYARDPLDALARSTRLLRTKLSAAVVMATILCLLFLSFGYLAKVRNQGNYARSSVQELITYQEYSLVNFEIQCASSGLGPYRMDYLLWLRRLVPWKLMAALGLEEREMPARYEPWAPAGFYEDLQWSLGIAGATVFAFLTGLATMWCYRRALCSPFYLLAYSQVSFSLLLAHSFNEFTSLSWIPAPLVLFGVLCCMLRRTPLRQKPAEIQPCSLSLAQPCGEA